MDSAIEILQPNALFRLLLEITKRRQEFNHSKISSLYEELLSLKTLHDSIPSGDDNVTKMACLKSAYLLSEPLVNNFLKQINVAFLQLKMDQVSFVGFFTKLNTNLSLNPQIIHSYYTTVVFRNKLIAHNDQVRQEAKCWSKNGEFYYLPHAFELDHSDIDVILHLKESYLRRFKSEELSDEKNYRQMLGFLFYNFPSLEISPDASKYSLSADRKKIDTLAEKIGVKSQTMNSIIKSVSDLLEELVNVSLHLCS